MTDQRRPGDEDDASDWLSSQFADSAAEPPSAEAPPSATPAPPVQPPVTQPPVAQPPVAQPPSAPPLSAQPPSAQWPPAQHLPPPQPFETQPPAAPPAAQPPAAPPAAQPPAAPPELVEPPRVDTGRGEPGPTQPMDVTAPSPAEPTPPPTLLPPQPAMTEPPQSDPLWFERLPPADNDFPADVPAVPDLTGPTDLDAIFADERFVEYADEPLLSNRAADPAAPASTLAGSAAAAAGARPNSWATPVGPAAPAGPAPVIATADADDPHRLSRRQLVLMCVAGALVASLAFVALFFLGTRIGQSAAASAPDPAPTASGAPQPELLPTAPLEPGTYAWSELHGGECIEPYSGPWAQEFTVVDCGEPHTAQLALLTRFKDQDEATSYPGAERLERNVLRACAARGVLDLEAAGAFDDVQVQGAFPGDETEWADLPRRYSCFVSLESGEQLETSLAGSAQQSVFAAAEKANAQAQQEADDAEG